MLIDTILKFINIHIMSKMINILDAMPHRERLAWITLLSILVTLVPYLAWMSLHPPTRPMPDLPTMGTFAFAVIVHAIFMAGGATWLRLAWPDDAVAPADERDRAVQHRALVVAYYVTIVGLILVGCIMPFTAAGWTLVNAAIATIVVAELLHSGLVIVGYRWTGQPRLASTGAVRG